LRGRKYTGKIFVLIDDEDSAKDSYIERYGDCVRVFHKRVNFDIGDNFDGPNGIATFARNECWNVAKAENLKYFLMLDDDLQSIKIRTIKDGGLRSYAINDMDAVIDAYCEFMDSTNIDGTGFGNGGDFIGGAKKIDRQAYKRVLYNSFLLRTDSRFDFVMRYSEDAVSILLQGIWGRVFIAPLNVQQNFNVYIAQKSAQKQKTIAGGCQDAYGGANGYVLRFYELMAFPSSRKLGWTGQGWKSVKQAAHTFPRIVSSTIQKRGSES